MTSTPLIEIPKLPAKMRSKGRFWWFVVGSVAVSATLTAIMESIVAGRGLEIVGRSLLLGLMVLAYGWIYFWPAVLFALIPGYFVFNILSLSALRVGWTFRRAVGLGSVGVALSGWLGLVGVLAYIQGYFFLDGEMVRLLLVGVPSAIIVCQMIYSPRLMAGRT